MNHTDEALDPETDLDTATEPMPVSEAQSDDMHASADDNDAWVEEEAPNPPLDAEDAEDGVKVITIGWQAMLLPFLAIVMLVGGFWLGRQLGGKNAAPIAAAPDGVAQGGPALAQAPAPPELEPIQLQLDPNTMQVVPQDQLGGGQAIPMPKVNHPLMGQPAPDFEMAYLSDGKKVKLSDFKGKPVMVNFWATWCPPCRMEMPWVQAVYDAHKEKGFTVLAVDAGEKIAPDMANAAIQQFVDSMGLTFPVLVGDNTFEIQRGWSVYGLPSTFLIDAEGTVVDSHTGMYPNQATLEAQLQGILATE